MISPIFNDMSYQVLPKQLETWDKYCKIIQWGRKHPTRFVEEFLNIQLTDYQKYIFLNSWCAMTSVLLCSRATGKATSLDTKVWLANKDGQPHYKTVGELKIGDKIYDGQGKLSEVMHLNPIIFDDYYEITFEDGEVIKCNGEHLWLVHDRSFHKKGQTTNDFRLLNTDYIYNNYNKGSMPNKNDWNFHVPINKPIEYAKSAYLPINPYILGYYLGDGTCGVANITSSLDDINEACQNLQKEAETIYWRKDKYKTNVGLIYVDSERELTQIYGKNIAHKKSLKTKLTDFENLINEKHIPERYLYSNVEDRLSLLQGLMDTDGCIDTRGKCEFTQTNEKLAKQVCQLIRSLGMSCTLSHKTHTGYIKKNGKEADTWRIYFTASKEMPVFRLSRKYNRLPEHPLKSTDRKAIVKVEKKHEKIAMRCITMRNEDGTFLCGENYTVTHNSFFSAPFIMTRSLLIPNHKTFIMSVSGGQASATFEKMEQLATNNIASVIGVSSVFLDNVRAANSKISGFTHGKEGMHVELFNGSEVTSLNSVPENLRGSRSNLNVYD